MLRGRVIAIQVYLKKQEKHQINNLTLYLKQLEKEEMKNPSVSRKKEIIAEINKAKSWFFEKVNKIGKLLARLSKKQREKNQINRIRNDNRKVTTDNTEKKG